MSFLIRPGVGTPMNLAALFELVRTAPEPSPTIHSCHFCSAQEIDPLIQIADKIHHVGTVKYRASRVIHGASQGCALFRELLRLLVKDIRMRGYDDDKASQHDILPDRWVCLLSLDANEDPEWVEITWESAEDELPSEDDLFFQIQPEEVYLITAEEDDPASETVEARPFEHSFMSDKSQKWTRSRLDTCEKTHPHCSTRSSTFMPTRLLVIEKSPDNQASVRLQTNTSSEGNVSGRHDYSTLSYCWGGEQHVQLNASTEKSLLDGILASSLPKTLHDAILVTLSMGLHHIWIDCLCIRQDEPRDLALEIAKIPDIYGNSFITISAARASHCQEGFIHDTRLPEPTKTVFRLPFACPDGSLGSIVLSNGLLTSPIDSRAWTLQEYILSRRVLQFTKSRLHWTCRETNKFQGGRATLPTSYVDRIDNACTMYRALHDGDRSLQHWMAIVAEYTSRSLTFSSDKLAAISGVAEVWAKSCGDTYAAGLWLSHLPEGLLWNRENPHAYTEVVEGYQAPTWSWASIGDEVMLQEKMLTALDPMVKIISCETMPTYPEAPYGQVSSNSSTASEESIDPDFKEGMFDLTFARRDLDYWWKDLDLRAQGCRVFCLEICSFDAENREGPAGLILVTEDDVEFRRIGVFQFQPPREQDVEDLGGYEALFQRYEETLELQREAFKDVAPRTIRIV
ncbi:hypothetical protein ACJZ2D_000856 [Fusarium nematophilum]